METKTKHKIKETGRYTEAVGRRKTSVARVRFFEGAEGGITINGKKLNDYFLTDETIKIAEEPIKKSKIGGKFKISVNLSGGGSHSQAEAVRHGISRALVFFDSSLRNTLKKEGFLTRDSRMKERRKFGLKKARKAPQWSKR